MANKCITRVSASVTAKSTHITSDFLNNIFDDIYNNMKLTSTNKLKKIDNELMCIPNFSEYNMILQYNYSVQQLKSIVSYYKLKINGNKTQLITRIYSFLYLSNFITKAQKWIRGYLLRKYNKLHGPGFKNKMVCTNTTDFFTLDPLTDLPNKQFFSFEDADGFIYGFDLLSMYNLIYKCDGQIKNPYNRLPISSENIEKFRALLKFSHILKIPICIEIKDIHEEISIKKSIGVITINGTSGFEALLLNKQVYTFGNSFYSSFERVINIQNIRDLRKNIYENRHVLYEDDSSLLKFVHSYLISTHEGFCSYFINFEDIYKIDRVSNAKIVSAGLIDCLEKITVND